MDVDDDEEEDYATYAMFISSAPLISLVEKVSGSHHTHLYWDWYGPQITRIVLTEWNDPESEPLQHIPPHYAANRGCKTPA